MSGAQDDAIGTCHAVDRLIRHARRRQQHVDFAVTQHALQPGRELGRGMALNSALPKEAP